MLVARWRPRNFDLSGTLAETFDGWMPLLSVGRNRQSFPSSHAATALGLAVGLALLYPRGRWLFIAYGAMASIQRLHPGSHFLSDTFVGAGLGVAVGAIAMNGAPPPREQAVVAGDH